MCKYCELINGEAICLTDRKHDDLYISKVEDEYYIENEGLTKFKLKYCPECGRDLQKKEPLDKRFKQIFTLIKFVNLVIFKNNCYNESGDQ